MNLVLLSGGSGKRLWPLSNEVRSKQFIPIFKTKDGTGRQSMVQRVYEQIRHVNPSAQITVATSKSQVANLTSQLGANVDICVEPCRRDTYPAILLACAYLADVKKISPDEVVVICPIDPFVEDSFFAKLKDLVDVVGSGTADLALLGIEPTYPSEKYGYILPTTNDAWAKVRTFKEKPDAATAQKYIAEGALWNAGVFAFRVKHILSVAKEKYGFKDYYDLHENYEKVEKTSFDYAVVEKESNIVVVRYSGMWSDLGTWNTLTVAMSDSIVGKAVEDKTCRDVSILNELDLPILAMGLKDVVIAVSPEGILVSDKHQSSYIKPYVEAIKQPVMFAEKSWGSYRVLEVQKDSLTVKVVLRAGSQMNYHSHEHRDEIWNIVSGEGISVVDGMLETVRAGDVLTIAAGCKHTIKALTELRIIEVQLGENISVADKVKYDNPL